MHELFRAWSSPGSGSAEYRPLVQFSDNRSAVQPAAEALRDRSDSETQRKL